jgi:hypothetical protein
MSEPAKRRERGTGGVYQRGRRYWIQYSVNGEAFRESTGTKERAEAERILDERLKQRRQGITPSKSVAVVYVIQRGDSGPIKVGISTNVKSRLKSLQTGNAEKLRLVRTFTMRDVERVLHAVLERKARLSGEWFPAEMFSEVIQFFSIPPDIADKRFSKRWLLDKPIRRMYTYAHTEGNGHEKTNEPDTGRGSIPAVPDTGNRGTDFSIGDPRAFDGGVSR